MEDAAALYALAANVHCEPVGEKVVSKHEAKAPAVAGVTTFPIYKDRLPRRLPIQ